MKAYVTIIGFWVAVFVGAWIWMNSEVQQPEGVLVAEEPRQVEIPARIWQRGDAQFTALAQFDVHARVLSKNRYHFDGMSDMSPMDLALGWGPMSDTKIVNQFSITQSQRFYYWKPKEHDLAIPMADVISHSANMHMIPATEDVTNVLNDIRVGEVVDLAGYLVQVNKANGWKWKSSLSRTDTGSGACEIVWVDRARRDPGKN